MWPKPTTTSASRPARSLSLIAFGGDASWTGYALISGHWYRGTPGRREHRLPHRHRHQVGDSYLITSGSRRLTIRIAGETFDPGGGTPGIIASQPTLSALDPSLPPVSTTWP